MGQLESPAIKPAIQIYRGIIKRFVSQEKQGQADGIKSSLSTGEKQVKCQIILGNQKEKSNFSATKNRLNTRLLGCTYFAINYVEQTLVKKEYSPIKNRE